MTDVPDDAFDDEAFDDDADDTPAGTDADFSGDQRRSIDVPSPGSSSSDFDEIARNAVDDTALADFLASDTRAILVHKSHRHADRLDEVIGYSRKQVKGACAVGLVVPCRQSQAITRKFVSKFPNTSIRLIDPEIHLHEDHYDEVRPSALKHWEHFRDPIPVTPDHAWTLSRLNEQVQHGATVLLSPTGKVEEANAAASLASTMDHVALARSIVGDAPMFVNLTLDNRWLSKPVLRDRLLEEIIDSSERHWFIRVRWPIVDPAYGQLLDPAILEGYKELATVCADEDQVLVLPNSDLTGWVATALGANGFGTATSNSDRRFADRRIIKSQPGQPKPDPKKRYYARSLLHTIEQPTHVELLGEAGYKSCICRFCKALDPDRASATTWSLPEVGYHYVHKAAMLTALLGSDPRRQARRKVRRALKVVADLPAHKELTGDDSPRHLETWRSLLR